MSDNLKELAFLALVCSAYWSVMISITTHNLSWFAFAAVCAVLAMIAWSE